MSASAKVLTEIARQSYEAYIYAYSYEAPAELVSVLKNAYMIAEAAAREARNAISVCKAV
jgi:hypothetical protein